MHKLSRLLALTFIESFATICVERGVYFFTHDRLAFGDVANLLLALAFGVAYAGGALLSHRLSLRWREKHLLVAIIAGQLLVHAAMAGGPTHTWVVVAGSVALGLLNGLKWPIIESYISAGQNPLAVAGAIGRFNVSWAAAVPLSLLVVGPLVEWGPPALFIVPAAINAASLWLCRPLSLRPAYLPPDHPERAAPASLARLGALLNASRWLMLSSYIAMFIIAPLTPGIFAGLGFGLQTATALAALLDVARVAAFVTLGLWGRWHGRAWPIWAGMLALPAGFFLVVLWPATSTVIAGELIFGLAAGTIYYGALYYAMLVKNAAVDAGGMHEALIGAGFAAGPLAGLLATGLTPLLGAQALGMAAGLGPVFALSAVQAFRALRSQIHGSTKPHDPQRQ